MARIRTIKPEFWGDEKVARLPRLIRLTFLGIISAMSDDAGRCRGNPRLVRAAVYPLDDDVTVGEVTKHLKALEAAGLIGLYTVANEQYIHIINWHRHQKINRPSDSQLPAPPAQHSLNTHGIFTEDAVSPQPVVESSGEERSVVEGNGVKPSGSVEPPPAKPKGWPVEASELWSLKVTPITPARCGGTLKAAVDRFGWPKVKAGIEKYIAGTPDGRIRDLVAFSKEANRWVRFGEMKTTDEVGDLTEWGHHLNSLDTRRAS